MIDADQIRLYSAGTGASEVSGIHSRSRSGAASASLIFSILLVLVGSAMQGCANGTIDAIAAAMLFLILGYGIAKALFRTQPEVRGFFLTYGVCVFVGGFAQCYSLWIFGAPQSTVDAVGFFGTISAKPPYYTFEQLRYLWIGGQEVSRGAPLAVVIWQSVYRIRGLLGLDFGPYVGIMFNAMVMGLTASVTVRTAREIFGNDAWRLRRVGTLFALCGLLILFGSIFLRDCFTTFFNALVLWGIVRWLCRPTPRNAAFAGTLTAVAIAAMDLLRSRSIVLFGLYWGLALCCWFFAKRVNFARVAMAMAIPIVLLLGSAYFVDYVQIVRELQAKHTAQYENILAYASKEDSIAMRLIVNQPLPVRLVFGLGSMMIRPIPLWAHFTPGTGEYHLIKGYHGWYQIVVLPLVILGLLAALTAFRRQREKATSGLFLAAYLLMNTLAVVATSMEQRHIAQFMPAFMILAAVPDTRDSTVRIRLWEIAIIWFFVVAFVHVAWAFAAAGR